MHSIYYGSKVLNVGQKGTKIQVADHFCRLYNGAKIRLEDGIEINDLVTYQKVLFASYDIIP